jgi:hypothetical protein
MQDCNKPNEELGRNSDIAGLEIEGARNSDMSSPQGDLEMRCGK